MKEAHNLRLFLAWLDPNWLAKYKLWHDLQEPGDNDKKEKAYGIGWRDKYKRGWK